MGRKDRESFKENKAWGKLNSQNGKKIMQNKMELLAIKWVSMNKAYVTVISLSFFLFACVK